MSSFELVQLVKDVDVRTLETGDKQGTITLRTVYPEDCPALLLLATKTIIKVRFEYEDESQSEASSGSVEDGQGE